MQPVHRGDKAGAVDDEHILAGQQFAEADMTFAIRYAVGDSNRIRIAFETYRDAWNGVALLSEGCAARHRQGDARKRRANQFRCHGVPPNVSTRPERARSVSCAYRGR